MRALAPLLGLASLRRLNVRNNKLSLASAGLVAASLSQEPGSQFEGELDLGGNPIGAQLAVALAEPLRRGSQLKSLRLYDTMMDDSSAGALGSLLVAGTNLQELDLGTNKLGDAGVKTLCKSLPNATIRTLGLGDNEISNQGAQHLAAALKLNGRLRTIYLQQNGIGDRGIRFFAGALERNHFLVNLHLSYAAHTTHMQKELGIGNRGQGLLMQALEKNRRIVFEKGVDCGIERHGRTAVGYGWAGEGGAMLTRSLGLRIKWQPRNGGRKCPKTEVVEAVNISQLEPTAAARSGIMRELLGSFPGQHSLSRWEEQEGCREGLKMWEEDFQKLVAWLVSCDPWTPACYSLARGLHVIRSTLFEEISTLLKPVERLPPATNATPGGDPNNGGPNARPHTVCLERDLRQQRSRLEGYGPLWPELLPGACPESTPGHPTACCNAHCPNAPPPLNTC